ncbi:MAG: Ferrous iron transport protein B [Syntrophorhabdus sp. PtaB.Bin184]|jgi:ferrous iron transport protein B|nr:MAG: Ferrous iron transport protein B [Syntrophorhabdus sp. PtaB.Bin184]
MGSKIVVALAGNPNSGKTTIFNNLTGARQHVGNYPGVTVERKEGYGRYDGHEIMFVDLPGTYSLTAYSAEELVARNFIVDERPDVVVDIIDSSNLERNLYLAVQLMETGVPLVLAFNMSDEARARGYEFDVEKFSRFFNASVVRTVGHKGEGMDELVRQIVAVASREGDSGDMPSVNYGEELEEEIGKIMPLLKGDPLLAEKYGARWLAVKLLENDRDVFEKASSDAVRAQLAKSSSHIEGILGENPETIIASRRYGYISGACQEAVHSTVEVLHTISDKIDTVITNRVLGIPIFLGLMYLVFYLTFTLGDPPMGWIEGFFKWLGDSAGALWPEGWESLLKSLIIDGIIGGVGGVIVFLPNILLLFFAIAILEDSGYMARAAFIMDRLMHRIGLHGKSFIPMLIGFGCSVPAIMATRMLENRRDRLVTMLVVPLMSCGARLPIYALIIPAFFPQAWNAPMLWIIYVIGILLAVISAKVLRSTIFKGESVPFVMELPPYRLPTLRGVLTHMWQRGWLYLKKAGTVILGISILLWALTTFPGLPEEQAERFEKEKQAVEATVMDEEMKKEKVTSIENSMTEASLKGSIAGRIGHALEPVLKPMGFDWRIGTALIGAFAAKEVFVAQLGIVYSVGKEASEESSELRDQLRANYTPLVAFCIMLFCLVSAPCMATIAVTRRESNSWKWALFQLAGLTVMAWILTVIVFQAGRVLGIGI